MIIKFEDRIYSRLWTILERIRTTLRNWLSKELAPPLGRRSDRINVMEHGSDRINMAWIVWFDSSTQRWSLNNSTNSTTILKIIQETWREDWGAPILGSSIFDPWSSPTGVDPFYRDRCRLVIMAQMGPIFSASVRLSLNLLYADFQLHISPSSPINSGSLAEGRGSSFWLSSSSSIGYILSFLFLIFMNCNHISSINQ